MVQAAGAIGDNSNPPRKSMPVAYPRKNSVGAGYAAESSGSGGSNAGSDANPSAASKEGGTSTFRTNYSSKETMAKNNTGSQEASSSL